MAKDMSKVYGEMLTKELVALRNTHLLAALHAEGLPPRKAKAEKDRRMELVAQINKELADRVAQMGIFA